MKLYVPIIQQRSLEFGGSSYVVELSFRCPNLRIHSFTKNLFRLAELSSSIIFLLYHSKQLAPQTSHFFVLQVFWPQDFFQIWYHRVKNLNSLFFFLDKLKSDFTESMPNRVGAFNTDNG